MANLVEQLRNWLLKKRPFRMKRLAKDPVKPSKVNETLTELPPEIEQKLKTLVHELPSHPDSKSAVLEALSDAIAHWQEHPSATNNSLIVIASPVSAVARILTESLTDWADENKLTLVPLNWVERPVDSQEIKSKLREKLAVDDAEPSTSVAVIPNLSWCFLRTAEGLDGIDYLRDELLGDRRRFWIIGSGQVGFRYLNSVLKLQAHCGEVITLPKLSGQQMQDWLMPVIETLNIQLDEDSIRERLQELKEASSESPTKTTVALIDGTVVFLRSLFRSVKQDTLSLNPETAKDDGSDSSWQEYFRRLARLSDGVGTIALQLFVKSIYYDKERKADKTTEPSNAAHKPEANDSDQEVALRHNVVCKLPRLPALPEIEQNELYILYSLLVHGDLTLSALADSLGEETPWVNNSVQILRSSGLIEQRDHILKVNPLHYPQLKRKLASNNFVINIQD
ncbi:hypothetical protein PN498_07590 [Oscillatoria sp. CS-180]|uniref:hypothetical protein n=1 Tax=Oscillatoria sp. CS-180 TaxID=3021720 RepID=UPI00232CF0D6|nr:hypothetical protein [Oscillatoria sp. CS-180]MDB9525844.1 hypothetical protein [Oscillatoria sp. CS-180]